MQGCPHRLELRQTKDKGWALYTVKPIPAGAFVIEYTGVMKRAELDGSDARSTVSSISDMQADHEDEAGGGTDEYAFDMTPRPPERRAGGKDAVDDLPLLPALHA